MNYVCEDVRVLDQALEKAGDDIPNALKIDSNTRARDTKAVVQISRRLDGGFLTFVLPLIIDSIFNKICPQVFGRNTISMLQNENMTFSQVQWRKRFDRVLQSTAIGGIIFSFCKVIAVVVKRCLQLIRS